MKTNNKSPIDESGKQPIAVLTLAQYPDFFRNHIQPCSQILWLTLGSMHYNLDMQRGEIHSGQVLCIKQGQFFSCESEENTSGYCIMIANGYLEGVEYLVRSANMATLPIRHDDIEELHEVVCKMAGETSRGSATRHDILRRYAEIFLIYITRSIKELLITTTKTRNIELTEDFMSLLDRHYKEKKMVSDYASLLAITPNYLNEIVKKVTGQAAGHHIRQRVALEAKRHAVHSSLCMKEVAYVLGFADLAHFSKFFKNTTGRNFTDFKRDRLTFSIPATSPKEIQVSI